MKHPRLLGATLLILLLALAFGLSMEVLAAPEAISVIDFEGFPAGTIVDSVSYGNGISGDNVPGFVTVFGENPLLAGNMAMIFDATCGGGPPSNCSGGDADLYKPELGNVLIISEDGDQSDPDDADLFGTYFDFDFSAWGPGVVTVHTIDILDVETEEPNAHIDLYSGGFGGTLLDTVLIPPVGNNGLETLVVDVSGVDFMRVTLNGSGAIDNIYIEVADQPTPTPTNTATNTPTATATNTPTNTPTSTPTNTPTNTPTATPPTPTNTPTSTPPTPTNTPTGTPPTPTETPTNTPPPPTETPTGTPTNTPTGTPPTPTNTPTATATQPPTNVELSSFGGGSSGGSGTWLWAVAGLLMLMAGGYWMRRQRAEVPAE